MYNFKAIPPVPPASDFVDIVLTRTQRKTPTVVHPAYHIQRIREFYMRKVRFTRDTVFEKLTQIINGFPKLDSIHPFYADLINVLYDRDHYKLALGQLNTARRIVDGLCKDYVRLLKYGEDLFRCKSLKRAALGRMCTALRKLKPSLGYLEEVRRHLSRLPSIDPATRTLLITGYPNVGKSSFMNKVSRADVEVQPYAFTTRAVFVGHFDYKDLPWQVLDTPGILDRPLEERNAVEMQAITTLAHLHSAVLYFLDISEQCGFSIAQQVALFNSIKPLFTNKPLFLVCTKVDAQPWETLEPESKAIIEEAARSAGATLKHLSNFTDEGITDVRNAACDRILQQRVEQKLRSRKMVDVMNQITITQPKPRDNKPRPPMIPESVLRARQARAEAAEAAALRAARATDDDEEEEGEGRWAHAGAGGMEDDEELRGSGPGGRILEKDRERAAGGPGRYGVDFTKYYLLKEEDWKQDTMPVFMDGKNVADYVDPDIWTRLADLEKEEAAIEAMEGLAAARDGAAGGAASAEELGSLMADEGEEARPSAAPTAPDGRPLADLIGVDPELLTPAAERALAEAVRQRRKVRVVRNRVNKSRNHSQVPLRARQRNRADLEKHLQSMGLSKEAAAAAAASAAASAPAKAARRKRGRAEAEPAMIDDEEEVKISRGRSLKRQRPVQGEAKPPRSRSRSVAVGGREVSVAPGEGFRDAAQKASALKAARRAQSRGNREGRQGEADRFIGTKMPKHLFSGKRRQGTHDRR